MPIKRKLAQKKRPGGRSAAKSRVKGAASGRRRTKGKASSAATKRASSPAAAATALSATANVPIRVLIAKPGLDGHDRGAKVVARALRDAGMEVIYTGLHQTPEMIVRSALQEDVQCIGLSILSGAHMTLFPAVVELLKREGAEDVLLFGGGIIPRDDVEKLKALGVREIFLPGASTQDIVAWVRSNAPLRD